jgi:hypothetical protein
MVSLTGQLPGIEPAMWCRVRIPVFFLKTFLCKKNWKYFGNVKIFLGPPNENRNIRRFFLLREKSAFERSLVPRPGMQDSTSRRMKEIIQ